MTFLSPLEDFRQHTLATVSGRMEQLRFLAELREEDGRYHHWGLARIYGEGNAHQAMSEAHTQVFLEILSTSIQDLSSEAAEIAAPGGLQEYVACQGDLSEQLLPLDLGGGLEDHFRFTLEALSRLARHADSPNHPNASPTQRPAR